MTGSYFLIAIAPGPTKGVRHIVGEFLWHNAVALNKEWHSLSKAGFRLRSLVTENKLILLNVTAQPTQDQPWAGRLNSGMFEPMRMPVLSFHHTKKVYQLKAGGLEQQGDALYLKIKIFQCSSVPHKTQWNKKVILPSGHPQRPTGLLPLLFPLQQHYW